MKERVHKMFLCRLFALLISFMFFWCFVYVSRENNLSDTLSSKSVRVSRPRRSLTNRSWHDKGQCTLGQPSKESQRVLKKFVNTGKSHALQSVVHCSVISLCQSRRYHAECYSNVCDVYDVHLKDNNRMIQFLSREQLSDFIETSLQQHTFTFVDDLNRHIDVYCHKSVSSRLKIIGDVVSSKGCETLNTQQNCNSEQSTHASKKNIHVLYFRFLSRWELQIQFPGLFSLLMKSRDLRSIDVLDFDKYQATKWRDDELLSLLLQGKVGPFQFENSLLDALHEEGYCFRLEDFSCSKSRLQEVFVMNTSSARTGVKCEGNRVRHFEVMLEKLCTKGDLTDTRMRTILSSLLLRTHQLDSDNAEPRPIFSVSILNIKDFKHSKVMDHVLRNFFVGFMNSENRVLLLLSGAGNPSFLRLDQSVSLQLHASNPVMILCSTFNMSLGSFPESWKVSQSSFSMKHVQQFLHNLTRKRHTSGISNHRPIPKDILERTVNTCNSLEVRPPFMCLCEEEFVGYENDTLMTGFAELAVGIINKRLKTPPGEKQSALQCATLSGVSFSNVQVGHSKGKLRLVVDLSLVDDLSNEVTFRRAVLDIWGLDKIPQADLHFCRHNSPPSPPAPLDFQPDQYLQSLCKRGESLSFRSSSQVAALDRWSQERHFGRPAKATQLHDACLYLLVRDYGDSVSVEAANACRDRSYDVTLRLSLMNMVCLTPLPVTVTLGHAQREFVAAVVKVSYTVATFAYRLDADFHVRYDNYD